MGYLRSSMVLTAALAVFVVLAGSVHKPQAPDTSATGTAEHPHTVIIMAEGEPAASALVQERLCGTSSLCQNGKDDIEVAVLRSGTVPERPTLAVVETDTNCNPDAYGISHCSNILRLPDGSAIEVQHDHNMRVYPCLEPGDTVMVESQASAS